MEVIGEFQSLLSQGISLLLDKAAGPEAYAQAKFQSLLSQGISLLWSEVDRVMRIKRKEFQSLLSQGISLLPRIVDGRHTEAVCRFNPFLVRASVYCAENSHSVMKGRDSFNPFLVRASVYWDRMAGIRHGPRMAVSIPS